MRTVVSVRELHLNTSAILKKVSAGDTVIVEKRGVPIAELYPVGSVRTSPGFPDIESIVSKLPRVRTDSGRILEEDRR